MIWTTSSWMTASKNWPFKIAKRPSRPSDIFASFSEPIRIVRRLCQKFELSKLNEATDEPLLQRRRGPHLAVSLTFTPGPSIGYEDDRLGLSWHGASGW